jgi:hypothetical protein
VLTRASRPRGRVLRIAVAGAVLLAGIAGGAAAGAVTASTASAASRADVATPAGREAGLPAADRPLEAAELQAKRTGHPVAISSLTTQTSTTVADPDGKFAMTSNVMPVRVKQDGRWVPVSATLRHTANGWYEPAATPSAVELSSGGTGALAVLTSPQGGRVSLTFPFRLPAPVIAGATATYRNVLPGVDLVATVTNQGGFSDVLEVRSPTAAAQLSRVRIRTETSSLSLHTDASGDLTATGPGGRLEFTGPAPRMWGSTGKTASLDMRAAGGDLVLTPDQRLLATASAKHPVYIDPVVNPASSGVGGYTEAQHGTDSDGSNCADNTLWDNPQANGEGTGYQNAPGSYCQGAYVAYYQLNTTNLNSSMVVSSATLLTAETYGSDLECSDTWPVTLEWTDSINEGTDGANEPGVLGVLGTEYPKTAWCGDQDVNFNVTSSMQYTTEHGATQWTFGLFGDEDDLPQTACSPSSEYNCGFMRFATNPSVTTVFDIAPDTPANTTVTPAPHDDDGATDYGCNSSGSYGWLGRTDLGADGDSDVTLNATVTSNIVGENVRAQWTVYDNSADNDPVGSNVVADPVSEYEASGDTVHESIGIALKDGNQYGYRVYAYDGTLLSGASADCHFNVDLTPPTVPVVTSTDFPESGSGGTGLYPDQTGTFSFASTDPVPTGCAGTCMASGVAKFEYSFNNPIATSGALSATPGQTVSFTPDEWGTNILYVEAVDNAGNTSQVAQYDFYVPWDKTATVVPGSIDGQGVPDLLATNTAGYLLEYPGDTDPAVLPVTSSVPGDSPDGTGWNTFQITHRGSMSDRNFDDLFAHKGANLFLYLSSGGLKDQFENPSNIDLITRPTCRATADNADNCVTYTSDSWSAVKQILAPGDVYASLDPADDQQPSLLTVENDQLWLYRGENGDALLSPVLIGTSGWSDMTLIAPGIVNGVLTLWARDTTNGDLYSYPLTLDSNNLPVSLGPATGTGSAGTEIGTGFTTAEYPTLASPGNLTGSGYPGLYAEDTAGNLWYYPGESSTTAPLSSTRQLVGMVDQATADWTLTDGSGTTAADATGNGNTGTLNSGVSWVTGTAHGTVASFNGTSGAITTSGPVLNTAEDFSVSGWAYLTKTGSWGDVITQDGTSGSGFYLQYDSISDTWAFSMLSSDGEVAGIRALSPSAPTLDTWTHLVGTYDASTGQMDLYVNGVLAGTAVNTTPFATTGVTAIGRGKFDGAPTDWFPGELSDVEAFSYTLTPAEVSAMYLGQLPVTQLS